MSDRTGLSRGDRNRNSRLARMRQLLPADNAIVGVDLADSKQAAVVTGHDSRVIARRRATARAWELGGLLDWAIGSAVAAGFASVTVACEPTGHRWRVVSQLAAQRGLALVCVQPLLVCRAREGEDLTFDKSDPKDAVIIARLAAGLHCYEPEHADAVWARLRHLGARRLQLTGDATAAVNQVRDLLECAWPAVLEAAGKPFRAATWCAAVTVALDRGAADVARVRRLGPARFEAAARRELPRWDATRPCLRIVRAVWSALTDPAGVIAHRPGALERAGLAMADWHDTLERMAAAETRMTGVLDDLNLTELVTSIAGLTAVGAAAILAETGDPARFAAPRSLARHAGLCPRDNASGGYQGKTSISGRGRPGLRVAAWRAVWAALPDNPVMAARFTYLTSRDHNRLARQQARTACAAALLRWLHVVITRQVTRGPGDRRWRQGSAAGGRVNATRHRGPRRPATRAGRARTSLEEPPRARAWAAPPVSSPSSIHAVGNNPLES
ncbi:MAG TPA: IS110 family transposase [Streptosporangiaceae bacterium]|nr:IS110 family transposase [Streptosporangiaceae bacterium]